MKVIDIIIAVGVLFVSIEAWRHCHPLTRLQTELRVAVPNDMQVVASKSSAFEKDPECTFALLHRPEVLKKALSVNFHPDTGGEARILMNAIAANLKQTARSNSVIYWKSNSDGTETLLMTNPPYTNSIVWIGRR